MLSTFYRFFIQWYLTEFDGHFDIVDGQQRLTTLCRALGPNQSIGAGLTPISTDDKMKQKIKNTHVHVMLSFYMITTKIC